jgi:putative YphP/YqiW family bacilliredoxin
MPYPEQLVKPMRDELARVGVVELRDAAAVEAAFSGPADRTRLLVINSVCGCAAANARPAVILSRQAELQPDEYVTVFAGQDLEATSRARVYLEGIPPSSPFIALFKGTDPVFVLERRHIEGRSASAIAMDLVKAYEAWCAPGSENGHELKEPSASQPDDEQLPPTFKSIL